MCSAKRRVMKPRLPEPTPTPFLVVSVDHLRGPEVEFCLCFLVVLCWLVGSRGCIIFFELRVAVTSRLSGADHLGVVCRCPEVGLGIPECASCKRWIRSSPGAAAQRLEDPQATPPRAVRKH